MRCLAFLSLFIVSLSIVCGLAATAQVPETASSLPKPNESPIFIERYAELQPNERVSIAVYEKCNKSVVNIDTKKTHTILLFGRIDDPGAGSGIVLDKEGHILTNNHVIDKVSSVTVTLFNGDSYDAKLVGYDEITDLAVIHISAPPDVLFPITFGDSSKLLVGQQIYAIGNPFGLERTLTSGLISSLNRSMPSRKAGRSIRELIQIDAAINPGNSGGALLDTQGRLIGINTAIASRSGGSHGVGFAIPTKTLARIVPQLIVNGKVIRGETGIDAVLEVSRDLPDRTKLQGLLVFELQENGAAANAGLRTPRMVRDRGGLFRREVNLADVIVGIDGVPVKKASDFTAIVDELKPDDRIVLDVYREGKIIQVPMVLK